MKIIARLLPAVLLLLQTAALSAQGYFTLSGPSFSRLTSGGTITPQNGRNFGFSIELAGDEFNDMYMYLGSDAIIPAVRGLKYSSANGSVSQGLLSGGFAANDVSLFTWRQGVAGETEIMNEDVGIILGFATDWRHISRPVTGNRNENFYSLGLMGGLFLDGDMLKDMNVEHELLSKYGEELTVALKVGAEAVIDERGSNNLWAELLLGIPLKDEVGIAISPQFASRKLLAWNGLNGHEHARFNTFTVKVSFYIYAD